MTPALSRKVRMSLGAVLAVAVAACSATSPSVPPTTSGPGPTEGASIAASLAPSPTSNPSPFPSPSPTPEPTPVATAAPITLCTPSHLAAAIVAGSVSHASGGLVGFVVTLKNVGPVACTVHVLDLVEMVDKNGATFIVGPAPNFSAVRTMKVGGVLKTTIQARNYCGGVPVEPVSVAFVLPAGAGTLRAKPLPTSPGDIVPYCFQGGVAGEISMSDWAP